MTDRVGIFNKFMTLQVEGKLDGAVALLADDVVMNEPMTGTSTGKAAVEATVRNRPLRGDAGLSWSEPRMEGDNVTVLGTGAPFAVKVVVGFDGADRINRIDIRFD